MALGNVAHGRTPLSQHSQAVGPTHLRNLEQRVNPLGGLSSWCHDPERAGLAASRSSPLQTSLNHRIGQPGRIHQTMKRAGAGVPFAPCASEPGSIAGPIRRVEAPVLPSGTPPLALSSDPAHPRLKADLPFLGGLCDLASCAVQAAWLSGARVAHPILATSAPHGLWGPIGGCSPHCQHSREGGTDPHHAKRVRVRPHPLGGGNRPSRPHAPPSPAGCSPAPSSRNRWQSPRAAMRAVRLHSTR
jgi:hypothetical protein